MAGDHQLLVGRHDEEGDAARRRRDARRAGVVGTGIELGTEPGEALGDASADRGGVLPDPRREDEGVEAVERGREQSGQQRAPMDEMVDREDRAWVAAPNRSRMSLETPESPLRPDRL